MGGFAARRWAAPFWSYSFVKWVMLLTPHHFEAQSPLGTGDGALGTSGPRTAPGMGLLTRSPPLLCPRTWPCT